MEKQLANFDELPGLVRDSDILYQGKTRLGGILLHVLSAEGEEYFIKTGTAFERIELLRENRNIGAIWNYIPTTTEVWFHDDQYKATLITKKVPGKPLHEFLDVLDATSMVTLLKDILTSLWNVGRIVRYLPVGVEEEIADVKRLVAENKLDRQDFLERSSGVHPEELLEQICDEIRFHDAEVISHGDFCLPNIVLGPDLKWTLIDWGKGGLGDKYRDLASLEGSLKRNGVDPLVFKKLLQELNLDAGDSTLQKMSAYNNLDLFWYSLVI